MENVVEAEEIAGFDYLKLDSFLPDEHKALVQQIRRFNRDVVMPNINRTGKRQSFRGRSPAR